MEKKEFIARQYSNMILNDYNLFSDRKRTLWFYERESGLWVNNGENFIDKALRERYLGEKDCTVSKVREVIYDLRSLCFKNEDFPAPMEYLIPFSNGIYNLNTEDFIEFKPDCHFTSKLAVNYNPESKECPLIDKVFSEFVEHDTLTDLYELPAYCMVPNYKIQEIFLLLGSGRNGKSVYANIITGLLGKDNVSAVSLDKLQGNNFAGADLHGKFANICQEMSYRDLTNTDLIKKLSGGDPVRAERKFKDAFDFYNHAKLIFLTNALPKTNDKTNAFYRRARIIRFPYSFEGEKEDRNLMEKITQQELEGLAYKCVGILREIIGRGFRFTREINIKENEMLYEDLSDPIVKFVKERCHEDPDGLIRKQDFKDQLDSWLRSKGHRIRSDVEVSKYMDDYGIDDQKKSFGEDGRKNAWAGIAW